MAIEEQSERIAREVLAALDRREQIAPLSKREPAFDLNAANRVNRVVCELRTARGETPVGRKLGFTNRHIWDEYGVYAPIWSYMYDRTVADADPAGVTFDTATMLEPKIEPEITLGLARTPEPGMDERALLACLGFAAHGFEVVQSLYPGWKFAAPDTIAAFGLHGALRLGSRHAINASNRNEWLERLTTFEVTLYRNGLAVDHGHAGNVLGGPLSALRNAIEVLARDPFNPPLAAGEIVTTGTITRAFPMQPGEVWRTAFRGAPFEGLSMRAV